MTKIYIAFYDDEDSGCRENWNTFYTPWVAATTKEAAVALAKKAIFADIAEDIQYDFNIDITTADPSTWPEAVVDEVENAKARMHIEVQTGEIDLEVKETV